MDVDSGYKYIEKIRGGVQWYKKENKDFISSIIFNLKNGNGNLVVHALLLDYQLKKFNSF